MKEKITKLSGFSLAALLIMLLSLFSFNAKAQQEAFAVPKDTLLEIKGGVPGGHDHVTRTYTVPAGVTKMTIQCWGGGAAGGYAKDYPHHCAGGGGGAYARVEEIDVTPGEKLTVEIGAGGVGKKSGIHKGGNTKVLRGTTVLVMAAGAPAVADNQLTGGAGALSANCSGDYTTSGGNGGNGKLGYAGLGCSGGGGGAAGSAGNGGNAVNADDGGGGGVPGISNSAFSGSYIPGKGGSSDLVVLGFGAHGGAGSKYGAGGAGAICSFWYEGYYVGGDGAHGAVLITYDDCGATAGEIDLSTSGCYAELINKVSAKGATGTYYWEKSDDNTNWVLIPGATNSSYVPSVTAYYRRGYTTHCGNSVQTTSQHVTIGYPSPGFVALTGNPAVTSSTVCYMAATSFSLSMYSSSVPSVKWQRSVNSGASWSDLGTYQPVGNAKVINETSLTSGTEIWYRAVYEPATSCVVPTSNKFILKVKESTEYWFDTTTVYIELRYGDKDTNVYIFTPEWGPEGSAELTNDRYPFNAGRLLGRVGPGTHIINWTLTGCGEPVEIAKKYVVEYPPCEELYKAHDIDGNYYNTVRIEGNCWMKENLRSQHYNLGDTILGNYVYNSAQYPDTAANLATFGRLYTWYAAAAVSETENEDPTLNIFGHVVGACPQGWFLPDASLMAGLNNYLSKDLRTTNLWLEENGTNLTGMSVKPAGCRNGENGRFEDLHISSYFWTSQEVISEKSYAYWIDCHCNLMQLKEYDKHDAMSVRCVKEKMEGLPTVIEYQPIEISNSSALFSGDVIDDGGLKILERGFCYSTTPMPELNDGLSTIVVNATPASGPYVNGVDGLSMHTVYYVRAYAKNAMGVAYSDQKMFSLINKPDTITFYSNGGSSYMPPQLVDRGVSTPLNPCTFTYPLSVFRAWATSPTGDSVYADRANITTHGNVKLYALWYTPTHTAITKVECGQYTWTGGTEITYFDSGTYYYPHTDAHGCTQVDTLYLTINPTYSFTESKDTTLASGQYYLWHDQYCYETGTYYDSLKTECCTCDSVYVLNLEVNNVDYDTVYFNSNEGLGNMPDQVYTRGIAQQLAANTFSWPMSVFKCWNTQPNGSGTDYTNQQNITTTGNMTLYAQWYHPQHQSTTVTECNFYTWVGGTGNTYTESGTHTYSHTDEHGCTQVDTLHLTIYKGFFKSETASISATYTPYNWLGHSKSYMISGTYYDSLKTIHNCDSVYKLVLNVTDSIKYAVTFDKNGGSGTTMSNQQINANMPTALKLNTYTNGYLQFTGWNTQPDGTGTKYADGAVVTLTAPLTLYAQWGTWCAGTPRANEVGIGHIDSVKDHQNNWYSVVQIGTQCWLKENMRATTSPKTGQRLIKSGGLYYNTYSRSAGFYDNDSLQYHDRGVLYNFCAAVDTNKHGSVPVATSDNSDDKGWNLSFTGNRRGICPEGWHIPSQNEFTTLANYTGTNGGSNVVRLATGDNWPNETTGTGPGKKTSAERNKYQFCAIPSGAFKNDAFSVLNTNVSFWSSTVVFMSSSSKGKTNYYCPMIREITSGSSEFKTDDDQYNHAHQVRCVRN